MNVQAHQSGAKLTHRRALTAIALLVLFAMPLYAASQISRFKLQVAGEKCADIFTSSGGSSINYDPIRQPINPASSPKQQRELFLTYLKKSNAGLRRPEVVGIEFSSKSVSKTYTVHIGEETMFFSLGSIDKIAARIHEQLGTEHVVYWVPNGFTTENRVAAFEASLQVQWAKLKTRSQIRSIEAISEDSSATSKTFRPDAADLPESLFARKASIKNISKPEVIQAGTYRGWYRILITFVVRIGEGIQSFFVAVLVRGASAASDATTVAESLKKTLDVNKEITPASVVARIESEVRKKNPGMTAHDIGFLLHEEFGKNFLVQRFVSGESVG